MFGQHVNFNITKGVSFNIRITFFLKQFSISWSDLRKLDILFQNIKFFNIILGNISDGIQYYTEYV